MKFKRTDYGFINDAHGDNSDKWYRVWVSMIARCYNPNRKDYYLYGGKGCYVGDEFKLSSNFKRFYKQHNPNNDLVMDKDILCEKYHIYPKVYSEKTITFITGHNNYYECLDRLYPIKYYENIKSTARKDFRITCRVRGWDFNDFVEIRDENFSSKFFYKFVGHKMGGICLKGKS